MSSGEVTFISVAHFAQVESILNNRIDSIVKVKYPLGFLQRVSRDLTSKYSMSFNTLALIDAVGSKEVTYRILADDFGGGEAGYNTVSSLVRSSNKKQIQKVFKIKKAALQELEASGMHIQTSSPLRLSLSLTSYDREVYDDIQKIYSQCQEQQ